jgi:hypothetical protein
MLVNFKLNLKIVSKITSPTQITKSSYSDKTKQLIAHYPRPYVYIWPSYQTKEVEYM